MEVSKKTIAKTLVGIFALAAAYCGGLYMGGQKNGITKPGKKPTPYVNPAKPVKPAEEAKKADGDCGLGMGSLCDPAEQAAMNATPSGWAAGAAETKEPTAAVAAEVDAEIEALEKEEAPVAPAKKPVPKLEF